MRVLITKEGEQYVAEGLEKGIFAQADNLKMLAIRFDLTYRANKDTKMADPAPQHVFEAWEKGTVFNSDKISFDESVFDGEVEVRAVAVA